MTRRPLLLAAVLVTAACVGCSGQTNSAGGAATASRQAAPVAPTTTAAANCGDPTASLRPAPGPLPAPGHMPDGTFMQKIYQRGRLIVGVDQNTLLFGSFDPFTGQIEGFDIDMAHQVAAAILGDPNKIDYRAITSAQRIPMVQNGTVDMVARTMTINCDRIKQVSFSTVYYRAGQKVLVNKDSPAQHIQDLSGKKVCATTGSTSIDGIKKNQAQPVLVDNWTDCLVALQRNQVDAVSTDDAILSGLAAQDPYTRILEPRFTDEPYGLAINLSHPEFVRFVNGVLDRMRADGTWASIYAKWLGPVTKAAPPPPPATYKD
jgi:polar amino acid transport system substrate-binding protein